MAQAGIESSGYIRNRWSYRWFAEAASNSCDTFDSVVGFDCAYNHLTYETGYRYRGRVVGHGAESDARIGSFGVILSNSESTTWQLLLRTGDLNRGGNPDVRHTLTATPQEIASVDVHFTTATRFGRVGLGVGYQEIDDAATGISTDETRAYLSWSSP